MTGTGSHCEPYHGVFDGAYLHVVGIGTEHEKIFLRANRRQDPKTRCGSAPPNAPRHRTSH